MRRISLLSILLFNFFMLNAQVKDTLKTDDDENTTNIQASFEYMNKPIFSGRDYMIKGPLLSPAISLNFKSGISLEFTSYMLPDDTNKTKQSIFAISYNKDLFDWWNIEGGYSLYHTSITASTVSKKGLEKSQTQTQTDNGLSLANSFDFDWIFFQNITNYYFGAQKGLDILTKVGKDFYLDNLTGIDDLTISPTLSDELGNHIPQFRQLRKKLFSLPTVPNSTKFQPLDYEVSLPVEYDLKGFTFNFTPSYTFPVNILANESTLGSHFFYFSAKITYQFDFNPKK